MTTEDSVSNCGTLISTATPGTTDSSSLHQPLLSSVRSSASVGSRQQPPPAQAFFHIRDDRGSEDAEEEELHNDEETPVMENHHHSNRNEFSSIAFTNDGEQHSVPLLGRRFFTEPEFWRRLVGVILLGIATSASAELLFCIVRKTQSQWMIEDSNQRGNLSWVYTTLTGGFMSGLLLVLMRERGSSRESHTIGCAPSIPHDIIRNRTMTAKESGALVLTGTLSLASGAPLGPEIAILAASQVLVKLLQPLDSGGNSGVCFQHCGIVASVSALSGIPILGPLLLLEVLAAIVSSFRVVEGSGHYAESLFLQVVTSAVASCTKQFLRHLNDASSPALTDRLAVVSAARIPESAYSVLLAIPVGLLCGCIGVAILGTTRALQHLRHSITIPLLNGPSPWFPALLFPTLAGAFHGLLAVACPLAMGSGMHLALSLWQNTLDGSDQTIVSQAMLLRVCVTKILSISVCVGFGLVGGTVVPVGTIGVYLGVWLHHWEIFHILSKATLMSACMVGCAASVAPLPLTGVVFAMSATSASIDKASLSALTVVLVTAVVAMGVTSGLVRSHVASSDDDYARLQYEGVATSTEMFGGGADTEVQHMPSQSDEDILANVRQAIFSDGQ